MDTNSDEDQCETSDEVQEPQVTSLDPAERKLARKLRIQRRAEAVRKAKLPPGEEEPEIIEKTAVEKQVETSWDVLERLILEGEELVTNVRVANDSREVERREKENNNRHRILKKLEDESNAAYDIFNSINSKWDNIFKSNDPLDIQQDMMKQKIKCDELIAQKDAIIFELKEELSFQDLNFSIDQRKQTEDIAILCQRVDKQVDIMRRAYANELKFIDEAIVAERLILLEHNNKKWEKLFKYRDEQEEANMNRKLDQMNTQEEDIYKLILEHQEKYRETKIQLETDVQALQEELQQMKALCLLNTEKLDYNYLILKRREDENLLSRSNQKRRINKLQDIVNDLRSKMAEYDTQTKTEIAKLTDEVIKINGFIIDVEMKSKHFTEINDKIYHQIWDMNVDEGIKLLKKILDVDKILHEQQLGVDWISPEKELLRKEDLLSYKTATEQKEIQLKNKLSDKSSAMDKTDSRIILLRRIITQLSEKSDFLIEDRLTSIMEPYLENEQMIIRLDNVFAALNITTYEDMDSLLDYFLPYTYCPICSPGSIQNIGSISETELKVDDIEELNISSKSFIQFEDKRTIETHLLNSETVDINKIVQQTVNDLDLERNDISDNLGNINMKYSEVFNTSGFSQSQVIVKNVPSITTQFTVPISHKSVSVLPQHRVRKLVNKIKCKADHILAIDSAYIIKGLKDFACNFNRSKDLSTENVTSRISKKHSTISRLMTLGDVTIFWDRFKEMFGAKRIRMWDSLYIGLQKYHKVLKDRHNLNIEVRKLRKQNRELKRLLKNSDGKTVVVETLPPISCSSSISIMASKTQNS